MSDELRKSPSGKFLDKVIVFNEDGIQYSGESLTVKGYAPSEDGDTVEIDFTKYTGSTQLDMDGKGIINHHDNQGDWTTVGTGSSYQQVSEVTDVLGNSTGNRLTITYEVDIEDSDGSNPKCDVFVFLLIARANGNVDIINMTNGDTATSTVTAILTGILGPCSGYTYRLIFTEGVYYNLQIAEDATTERKARCRASISAVRSKPA